MIDSKCTLLLVDDSRISRLSLIRQLNTISTEFDILEAASADEALAIMQEKHAAAALIDFNMPGRNGIELAELFQQSHPQMRMAIVTANIQDALANRARQMGLSFIGKPTTSQQLADFLGAAHG